MILPAANLSGGGRSGRKLLLVLAAMVLAFAVAWVLRVNAQIQYYAHLEEARPADAIAIFGAAEYDGHPSPVFRARLDHGLTLYRQGIAPLVITLGGAGDDVHSEGAVGHDYLLAHGIPEGEIIAETQSSNTEQSAERLATIARANHLQRIVVVSDGTHLFRIHAICDRDGLDVYTSPRPPGKGISGRTSFLRLLHEIASYTAWRLHVH